jgi:anti-sigma regulatory factor (Ser/Thr protein kinase)
VGARGGDVFDIVLACAEAFANALEHPHEPSARLIDVDGQLDHGAVTVTLRDYGSWRSERERAEGGYGLPLMRTLMDTVELDTQAEGTSITMRRQLTRPALGHRDGNPATYEHDDGRADAGTACSFR